MGLAQSQVPAEMEHILVGSDLKLLASDEYAITFERLNQSRSDFILRLDVRQALKSFFYVPFFFILSRYE